MQTPDKPEPASDGRTESLEDRLLVTRCQLGEPAAFDELVSRWHLPLWKYARRLTDDGDAAAEAVQDVWLRVVRGIGRLRDPGRMRAWMFGIARRVVMDRLRERYSAPEREDVDLSTIPDSELQSEIESEIQLLEEQLALVPVVEREVLVLFYLKELSLRDVSEVLGLPIGTVKSRLFRARMMLRRQLTNAGGDR